MTGWASLGKGDAHSGLKLGLNICRRTNHTLNLPLLLPRAGKFLLITNKVTVCPSARVVPSVPSCHVPEVTERFRPGVYGLKSVQRKCSSLEYPTGVELRACQWFL